MGGKGALRSVARLASRQHGLVTRRQLLAAGLTRRQIDGLVASGVLHRVHAGVYALGAVRKEPLPCRMAAVLATDGVLSHESAAEHWGLLPSRLAPMHITRATRAKARLGIVVHEGTLDPDEVAMRFGVPCTTLVRTLIDLAGSVDADTLARAFDQAQVIHRLKPVVVAAALLALPGRRGAKELQVLLADAVDPGAIESHLELRFLKFCRDFGLPRPEMQIEFGPFRADFLFREWGVAVETDSRRWHGTAARRARDARKTAHLESLGLAVVRVRWQELRDTPALVAERILDASSRPFSPHTGEEVRFAN